MSKINWAKALTRYISDSSMSYRDVASEFGVSHTAVEKRARLENWLQLREETMIKLRQKLPETVSDIIAEANRQDVELSKLLISKGLTAIREKELNPDNWDKAKEAIKDGILIRRKALNIDNQPLQPTAIQVNFGSKEVERWAE